jgi:hypothetical protein
MSDYGVPCPVGTRPDPRGVLMAPAPRPPLSPQHLAAQPPAACRRGCGTARAVTARTPAAARRTGLRARGGQTGVNGMARGGVRPRGPRRQGARTGSFAARAGATGPGAPAEPPPRPQGRPGEGLAARVGPSRPRPLRRPPRSRCKGPGHRCSSRSGRGRAVAGGPPALGPKARFCPGGRGPGNRRRPGRSRSSTRPRQRTGPRGNCRRPRRRGQGPSCPTVRAEGPGRRRQGRRP